MYCILMAGMPASGKSTMAEAIAEKCKLPIISKDLMKEILYDHVGFQSRAQKVNLGVENYLHRLQRGDKKCCMIDLYVPFLQICHIPVTPMSPVFGILNPSSRKKESMLWKY